jgi:hypothetical protein
MARKPLNAHACRRGDDVDPLVSTTYWRSAPCAVLSIRHSHSQSAIGSHLEFLCSDAAITRAAAVYIEWFEIRTCFPKKISNALAGRNTGRPTSMVSEHVRFCSNRRFRDGRFCDSNYRLGWRPAALAKLTLEQVPFVSLDQIDQLIREKLVRFAQARKPQ